jgi:tRNA (guanine-N7-)-methyltransferase
MEPVSSSTPTDSPSAPQDSLILRPDILQRLDWPGLFGRSAPVELELGAGDGSFLMRHAALHPDHDFLGVERLLGRLRKIDRKSRRLGLTNVRALRLEASYVLEWMIPAGSLEALHIYFPDPWPKRRHWKRRLIDPRFTELVVRAIRPGGHFHVRTDDASYFEQMMEVGTAQAAFLPVETPTALLAVVTDFEADFHQQGIATRHASWQIRPIPNP